jgi:ABC-2 type transport system permease protein
MSALRSYRLLVTWQSRRMRGFLPLGIVVQALFSLGIVAGYPLLFPSMDQQTILYIAIGGPAVALITIGLVAVPQLVTQARVEGTLDYMRSLPVPRLVYLLADTTVWLAVVVPGVALAVVISSFRFGLDLQVSPLVIPAVILVTLTATSVGYAMASVLPPMVATMATQILVVFILMFSPLNFPPDRLPGWLETIHSVLPIQAMGEVMRGTLAPNTFPLTAGAFLLLGTWCLATFAITGRVMTRRG